MNVQEFKAQHIRKLPDRAGVYALCDLDEVVLYVGQATRSKDTSIRGRVQRHLTSARSDVIANRQLDVWEIAYVWAWPVDQEPRRKELEAHLFHKFNDQSPLVNGKVLVSHAPLSFSVPRRIRVQIMPDEEIAIRQQPALRFPRQIQHFNQLVDYVLNTQDKPHLRRALQVYYDRLTRYFQEFLGESD